MARTLFSLSQSDTTDPVLTVLRSGGIAFSGWSRTGQGEYVGTLTSSMPSGTLLMWHNPDIYIEKAVEMVQQSDTLVLVRTMENGALTDSVLEEGRFIFEIDTP